MLCPIGSSRQIGVEVSGLQHVSVEGIQDLSRKTARSRFTMVFTVSTIRCGARYSGCDRISAAVACRCSISRAASLCGAEPRFLGVPTDGRRILQSVCFASHIIGNGCLANGSTGVSVPTPESHRDPFAPSALPAEPARYCGFAPLRRKSCNPPIRNFRAALSLVRFFATKRLCGGDA